MRCEIAVLLKSILERMEAGAGPNGSVTPDGSVGLRVLTTLEGGGSKQTIKIRPRAKMLRPPIYWAVAHRPLKGLSLIYVFFVSLSRCIEKHDSGVEICYATAVAFH